MEISGQVRYLESISDLSITFDGVKIPGTSVKKDGTFVVNYFVPDSTSLGKKSVVVKATDNYGKSDTKSINVKIVEQPSTTKVSLKEPVDGKTVSFPVSILAIVSGGNVDGVSFKVVGDSYNEIFAASKQTNGWLYSWAEDPSITKGNYKITVTAKAGGNTITGNTVTINVN